MGHQQQVASYQMVNRAYFLFFLFLLLNACEKQDSINLTWNVLQDKQGYSLEKIHFFNDKQGVVVGGRTYNYGLVQYTEDGGFNWTKDTISKKLLRDFDIAESNIYASGIDNYILQRLHLEDWEELRPQYWDASNGIIKTEMGFILVGGIALKDGFILSLSNDLTEQNRLSIEGELSAVSKSDEQTFHTVGYGQIYRSVDAGMTWEINPQDGDFYKDVFFANEQKGWIVGSAGSILKSENAGKDWSVVKKPRATNKEVFNAVFFVNELDGCIVGDNGLVWLSDDAGDNWQAVLDLPLYNYTSVYAIEDVIWICSDEGHILRLLR